MESIIPSSSLYLFKETLCGLEVPPSNVVQIQLSSKGPLGGRSRQQHRILRAAPSYKDEETFRKQYLASSSSIFFGRSSAYPRNIFWRVMNESRVLELRSSDLSKSDQETKEANLVIQLLFPSAIKHGCVALADGDDPQALDIFVLARSNDLYTCSIPRVFFCSTAASEGDMDRWCKVCRPSSLSMGTPHCLIAGDARTLHVSLADGRLLRLTRSPGGDGSQWQEATYGDGQWGASLRSLVRWQGSNAVRHDGTTLETNTPVFLAASPDRKHLFAVCLDHTLRAWSPENGASVFSKDLLLKQRESHEIAKILLDPTNLNVLQLFQSTGAIEGDLYYAVTFTPHDDGHFKFWGIRDPDSGEQGIRDLFPEYALRPPDPDPNPNSKAIWKMIDFRVSSEKFGQGHEIWILMRSNRHHKLYQLKFDISSLGRQWQDGWCLVYSETAWLNSMQQRLDLGGEVDWTNWLDISLGAGLVTSTLLETALNMFIGTSSDRNRVERPSLKDTIITTISSSARTRSKGNDERLLKEEWTIFHQCLQDIGKSCWNALSLAHDDAITATWIINAGGSSVVRSFSRTELISANSSASLAKSMHLLEMPSIETDETEEPRLPDELAIILDAATNFRRTFNHQLKHNFESVLKAELWLEPSLSVPFRIQSFYDQCGFADEISGGQFDSLTRQLEAMGGFTNLETSTFRSILETLSHDIPATSSELSYTGQGLRLLINGASDIISELNATLSDLLALVVVVDLEVDRDETPMDNFDASEIYTDLLHLLKQCQIMDWLVKHVRVENLSRAHSWGKKETTDTTKVTILESIFARDLKPQSTDTQNQSEAITNSIQDLLKWVVGGNNEEHPIRFEDVPVYILCDLLKKKNLDLAQSFLQFLPSTAWATYTRARLMLLSDKASEAAVYFKKSAFKLSRPNPFDYQGASNGLLEKAESAHFGQGLPVFYSHILNLFEAASYPTQTIQFAHLALQQIPPTSNTRQDQSMTTNLLNSLFYASLKISDITSAFSALTRHPTPKEILLPTFIRKILDDPSTIPTLISLPFPPNLHPSIDMLLATTQPPASKILASWRLHHGDYRGAAAALLPSLKQQQQLISSGRNKLFKGCHGSTVTEETLDENYLTVINLLACAGPDDGWVLTGGSESNHATTNGISNGTLPISSNNNTTSTSTSTFTGIPSAKATRRELVTLQDVRGMYQKELDRRSVLETGRFAFAVGSRGSGGGDAMDFS